MRAAAEGDSSTVWVMGTERFGAPKPPPLVRSFFVIFDFLDDLDDVMGNACAVRASRANRGTRERAIIVTFRLQRVL